MGDLFELLGDFVGDVIDMIDLNIDLDYYNNSII